MESYDYDELLDLVDANDQPIQKVVRGEYYRNQDKYKGYLRAAELFIQNSEGKLWIPRRTAHKKIAPNGLDYSAGGHVSAGEDYGLGLTREIEEELNMIIHPEDLEELKYFKPTETNPWYRKVFRMRSDSVPEYNKEDFCEYYWLLPDELIEKLEAGEPAKISLLETVRQIRSKL